VIDEATIAPALDDVRALVQADGGDMLLEGVDPAANSVSLRLVLEGASCEECVMPREFLEQIALDMLRKQAPELAAVSIDDPREHPDYVPQDH
jgi:Fe-S cluster biogenesis protein NfuA